MTIGITFDSGALIAFERGDDRVRSLVRSARDDAMELHVPATVYAQCWRGGSRQASLARLLRLPDVLVVDLDRSVAKDVGVLCGASGHHDIVDVHVAWHARHHGHAVATADPADIARVDPGLTLIVV